MLVIRRRGIWPGNSLFALHRRLDGPFEGAPALPNTGALLWLNPNGTFTVVEDGLNQPTSMEIIGHTAYVVSLAARSGRSTVFRRSFIVIIMSQ
jgi:hypothetical protein